MNSSNDTTRNKARKGCISKNVTTTVSLLEMSLNLGSNILSESADLLAPIAGTNYVNSIIERERKGKILKDISNTNQTHKSTSFQNIKSPFRASFPADAPTKQTKVRTQKTPRNTPISTILKSCPGKWNTILKKGNNHY